MIFAAHVASASNLSLLVYLGIGVVTLFGFAITAAKWLKQQGAAAATLESRLKSIENAMKPNGKDTQQVGDIVARTETKVGELATHLDLVDTKIDQHIGASEATHVQMWREIRKRGEAA